MSWVPSKRRFVQFAALAILAGELSYASAQVLILRSLGPSARNYRAGQVVAPTASFRLRAGDQLVILNGGRTRTFRGPGVFRPDSPPQVRVASGNRYQSQVGATRSIDPYGDGPRPSDLWQFDASESGTACLPAGAALTLWRPNTDTTVRVTLAPLTGTRQQVIWDAGQSTLAWPTALPLTNGARYTLNFAGEPRQRRMTVRILSAVPTGDDAALAQLLVDNQCSGQLSTLIAMNRDPQDRSGGSTTR